MTMYPHHMRRRRRDQLLSYSQNDRFNAEKNAQLLEHIEELFREHRKHNGEDGFRQIVTLACEVWGVGHPNQAAT